MDITLHKLLPDPLAGLDHEKSDVWEKDLVLTKDNDYLIHSASGQGKTSLLSIIYGLRSDYRGDVRLGGTDIASLTRSQWTALRVKSLSYVFQGLDLFPELTGMENIHIKNRLTRHQPEEHIHHMAVTLGIDRIMDRPAARISYGQKQRIAIIRALCQPFDFLLLDEPFSHLDSYNTQQALNLIREACHREEAGLILTSLGKNLPDTFTNVFKL